MSGIYSLAPPPDDSITNKPILVIHTSPLLKILSLKILYFMVLYFLLVGFFMLINKGQHDCCKMVFDMREVSMKYKADSLLHMYE